MATSFLQLQKRVDSGLKHRRAVHSSRSSTESPSSPASPSALKHLLRREVFVSDPTIGAAEASFRAEQMSSPMKRGGVGGNAQRVGSEKPPVTAPSANVVKGPAPLVGDGTSPPPSSVFWRECRLESFVRREAVFYNYLLTKSNNGSSGDGEVVSSTIPPPVRAQTSSNDTCELSITSAAAAAQGILSAQVDQPSMLSLLWSVSQVAKTSHLTGGDGSFFLRREFINGQPAAGVGDHKLKQAGGAAADASGGNGKSTPTHSRLQSPPSPTASSNGNPVLMFSHSSAQQQPPISIDHILKLFGNERTFQPVAGGSAEHQHLYGSKSYLLTESYEVTLAEHIRAQTARGDVDAVVLTEWCRVIASQLAAMHRVGVLHNNIHAESIVLCKDHSATSGRSPTTAQLTAKISWLFCATMQDLQVVRGLRKQTLSQSRADPAHSEFHTLNTSHLPTDLTNLAKSYSSVLPPEWFAMPHAQSASLAASVKDSAGNRSSASLQRQASTATEGGRGNSPFRDESAPSGSGGGELAAAKLRHVVVPTEKSDAFLFGKLLQQLFTNTMVEFNPHSVVSVSSHYLSKGPTQMGAFSECPSKIGTLSRVDEINSECLRHLITAATVEDRETRWSVKDIAEHPFFWSAETIIEFMSCVIEFAFPASGPSVDNPQGTLMPSSSSHPNAAPSSSHSGKQGLRESFRETVQKSQAQQSTKKLNITAPELSSMRGISKQLSTWVVEPRNWITQDVVVWVEQLCLESRDFGGAIRTSYENLNHQQVEFLVNVFLYMRDKRRVPSIADGDAHKFVSQFLNRMFPTLLMETVAMVMSEEDAPKFSVFLTAKIRQNWLSRRKREAIPHLQSILSVTESLCREKSKTIAVTGYDHVVQYVGAFPQYPVHIAESERVQVVKKGASSSNMNNKRGKPNLSSLPKWAQIQIAAADV